MGWDNVYLMQNLRDTLVQKKSIDMELGRTGYSEDPEYYLAACYIFDHPEMLEMNEYYSVCVWVGDLNLFRPLRVGNWTPEVHDGNEPRWVRYERQPDEVIKSIYNLLCDFADKTERHALIDRIGVFFHSQRLLPGSWSSDGLTITNHVIAKLGEHIPADEESKALKELIQEANREMDEGLSNYVDSARKLKAMREQEAQYKIFYSSNLS